MSNSAPFTPEQIQLVRELHAQGCLFSGIATRLGVSYYRLQRLATRLGLRSNFRKGPWSSREVIKLIKLRKKGRTVKEASIALKRSEFSVNQKWAEIRAEYKRRGLSPPNCIKAGPGRGRSSVWQPR